MGSVCFEPAPFDALRGSTRRKAAPPQVEPPKAYVLDEASGAWSELEDPIEVSSPALEEKPKKQKTPKKKGKCTPKQAFENAREPTSPEAFLKAFAKDPRKEKTDYGPLIAEKMSKGRVL